MQIKKLRLFFVLTYKIIERENYKGKIDGDKIRDKEIFYILTNIM